MSDPKQLARLLHEIADLLPEYSQLNRDLLGLHGIGYDLTGIHAHTGSPLENAYITCEQRAGVLDQLAEVAADWGHREGDGEPAAWMAHHIGRVVLQRGVIADEHADIIRRVHGTLNRLILKPATDEPTPDELRNRLILDVKYAGRDHLVTRAQAALILDVDAHIIRRWIHRGRLQETSGKVSLKEAINLKEKTRANPPLA